MLVKIPQGVKKIPQRTRLMAWFAVQGSGFRVEGSALDTRVKG